MTLQEKYKMLLSAAKDLGVQELEFNQVGSLLRLAGKAPSADAKNKIWDLYNQIDPNFISNDLQVDIDVISDVLLGRAKVVTETTGLNLRKGPGIEVPVLDTIGKGETVQLLGRANSYWWLVRTEKGMEGYCYATYLEVL